MKTSFLLFSGDTFYAAGGWRDYIGAYTTITAARAVAIMAVNNSA